MKYKSLEKLFPKKTYQKIKIEHVKAENYQKFLKIRCWPPAFTSSKVLLKARRSETSLHDSFFAWFWKKNVLHSINWPNLVVWLTLLLEILGNSRIVIIFFSVLKLTLAFLSSHFPAWPTKGKNLTIFRGKRASKMKWNALSFWRTFIYKIKPFFKKRQGSLDNKGMIKSRSKDLVANPNIIDTLLLFLQSCKQKNMKKSFKHFLVHCERVCKETSSNVLSEELQ